MGIVDVDAKGILGGIGQLAKDIRQAITGKNPELEVKVLELENLAMKAQTDINLAEAQSQDNFTRRWRPFIGWVCGAALAYNYLVQPIAAYVMSAMGVKFSVPVLDTGELITLLFAMLGFGGLRTYEKVKNATGKGR